ncbi:MAG: hypothetical protein M3R72_00710, partial [Bacteroidota bacterium]|nr:hypothetical protein [Bacteroidota bacterium]
VRVRKAIRQITTSPDYKLIKSDNSLEVFRIQMNVEDVSCLIYCSFFTMDPIRMNGIFKVSNLPSGNLSEQELITLRSVFINKFKFLLEAKPSLNKNYLHKEVKETINQNSALPTLKPIIPLRNFESRKSVPLSNYSKKEVDNDNKGIWILFWIIIILLAVAISKNGKMIHVDSYEKTNGTHVHSYDRKP